MKKLLPISMLFFLFLAAKISYSQGFENFNNYVGTSGTYSSGTFQGQDGSTWNYVQCRSDRVIAAPSPCLGKARNPMAKIYSGSIAGGCGTLSFDYKQGFSTAVNLDVYINNTKIGNVTSPGGNGDTTVVHNSGTLTANILGNFVIKFIQADSAGSGQVTIDNVTWTGYNTLFPEPTNYPEDFSAVPSDFTVTLSWTDATTGAQLPTAYLIKASSTNNITAPVDGVPVADDPNLADGTGALNINQGTESCIFTDLPVNTHYYFAIFPYTNSGTSINYKSDGTWPTANTVTPNTIIINQENFGSYTLGSWSPYDVTGAQFWTIDSIHGIAGTPCARISGYANGANNDNEDWLISPSMNFNNYINEVFTFQTAKNYTGNDLQAFISNDYDGEGDPNNFTWNPLTATISAGGWVWTKSGSIDVSGTNGTNVYVAFKYTSTTTASATWEVDNILVTGEYSSGIQNKDSHPMFSLSPNPANGKTQLISGNNDVKTVQIISITGQTLNETTISSPAATLDLSGFGKGIYFVKVTYNDQTVGQVRKLIVQ
jgi:hypothetical protein